MQPTKVLTFVALTLCEIVVYPAHAQVTSRPTVDQCRETLRRKSDDQLRREALKHLEFYGVKARPAVPELAALFASSDEELRLGSAMLLAQLGDDVIPEVAKQLQAKDAGVRYYALATLAWMGKSARTASEVIVNAVGDPSLMVRLKAIQAAGCLEDDPHAVKALLAVLKDENVEIRGAALDTLKKIGSKAGLVAHLYSLMADADGNLALAAVKTVTALDRSDKTLDALLHLVEHPSEVIRVSIAQSDDVRQGIAAYGQKAVPKLIALLERSRKSKQDSIPSHNAAQLLGVIGSPRADEAIPLLRDMLLANDGHSYGACYGLSQLGQGRILTGAAQDEKLSVDLRMLCVRELGRIGIDAIPTLAAAAGSKHADIRSAAVQALGDVSVADAAVLKTLTAALRDTDAIVRRTAIFSLNRFNASAVQSKETLDALRLTLLDFDEHNGTLAHMYFFQHGNEPHATLARFLDSPKDSERLSAACRLLLSPANPNAAAPVKIERLIDMAVKGLEHKDESLRMRCALALAQGRHVAVQDKLLPYFRACAKSAKAEVRIHGIRMLAYCSESAKAVHKEFALLLDDKDEQVRYTALMNMYNVGFDEARSLSYYEKALKVLTGGNREHVIGLAAFHGEKALPILRAAAKDKDTRQAALRALAPFPQKHLATLTPELRQALAGCGWGAGRSAHPSAHFFIRT